MLRIGAQFCARNVLSPHVRNPVNNLRVKTPSLLLSVEIVRNASFFNKISAELLWKGVTSVSNAGKKRGRGKGGDSRKKRNLNLGQKSGFGVKRMVWPGLTCPVIQGKTLIKIQELPPSSEPKKVERPGVKRKRPPPPHPLERGWTGRSFGGRKIGPPDDNSEMTFENFESIIIFHKIRSVMVSKAGRKKKFHTFVLTGNGNGVIGMGSGKALDSKSSIRLAKNRAAKKLLSINLINQRTVNHDFHSRFGFTSLNVYKKPPGHGLVCHNVVKACCLLLGIKDIAAKVEGSVNYLNLIKAFLLGLLRQKTYQQIADEKKLHVVEKRKEQFYFPTVLASPKECLSEEEVKKSPVEFEEYIMGRLPYKKPTIVPFFQKLPSWETHLKRTLYKRNHEKVKIDLMAKYGELRSHLTDVYPECREPSLARVKEKSEG